LKYVDCKKGEDVRVRYDRIVCDVPCSSDAAIRKIPQKWAKWSTKDGQSLHPLQLQILKRGIEVLKVGGKISYSTCSLNPIENEAVVAAALKEYAGKIRLLNVALPGFRFQEGFTNWRFLTQKPRGQEVAENESHFEEYSNYSEVPNDYHSHVKETMFETYYPESIRTQLTACLRVMPHHQNTSGFFITIIEKIAELDGDAPILATEDSTFQIPSVIQQDKPDFKFFRCDPRDPDTEYIIAYYGFDK
jgi:tRNA (cytosine34-C5)-methyltransferase